MLRGDDGRRLLRKTDLLRDLGYVLFVCNSDSQGMKYRDIA